MVNKLRSNGGSYSAERPLLHAFPIKDMAEDLLALVPYKIIRLLERLTPPRDVQEDLSKSLRGKRDFKCHKADC
eukprot:3594132-Heterocapsa_arctica.AAC.1